MIQNSLKFASRIMLVPVLSLLLFSCKDELEIFRIERLGIFSFSPDNIVTLNANDVHFYRGKAVLYYYDPSTFEMYTRYLMEARGQNEVGGDVIVSIEIDLETDGSFIGVYKPSYELGIGGIYSFNVLDERNGTIKSYNMDPEFLGEVFIQVERQNVEENLILGNFFARLQNDQDPSEKVTLYQGMFKDISYTNEN